MDISNRHFLPMDTSESPIRYSRQRVINEGPVSEGGLDWHPPSSSNYFDTPTRPRNGRAKEDLRLSELTPLPIPAQRTSNTRMDDMFARKQRDSYQVMGIDLTAYSTRGLAIIDTSPPPSPPYKSPSKIPRRATAVLLEPKRISKRTTKKKQLPPSELARTVKALSDLSAAGPQTTIPGNLPRWDDIARDSSRRESGGGLASKLALYGEMLLQAVASYALPITTSPAPTISRARPDDPPLRLSELSPSKARPIVPEQPIASTSRAKVLRKERLPVSPIRPAKKRVHPSPSPQKERKKGRLVEQEDYTGKGKAREVKPVPKRSSAVSDVFSIPARAPRASLERTDTRHLQGTSRSNAQVRKPGTAGGLKSGAPLGPKVKPTRRHATTLTVPNPPRLTGDVFRQKAQEKLAQEREKQEALAKEKRQVKANLMPIFDYQPPAPLRSSKPTVPTTFTFQSDLRAQKHKDDFKERRKAWEQRTQRAGPSVRAVPDFASLHASQAASSNAQAASRRSQTVPVPPPLTTSTRAVERQKFDDLMREKEKLVEELKAKRRLAKEQEEETVVQEDRKRTVIKANTVPIFYKAVPKKTLSANLVPRKNI